MENEITYKEIHIKNFLKSHPAISLSFLEKKQDLPQGTLRHFLKERRGLPNNHFKKLENELVNYGYKPFDEE